MVFGKRLLENTLTVPLYNYEAASELDLLKVAPCPLQEAQPKDHHLETCYINSKSQTIVLLSKYIE